MSLYTYSQMQDECAALLDRTNLETRIAKWINVAYSNIAGQHDWSATLTSEDISTIVDTYSYALSSDFRNLISVRYIDGSTDSYTIEFLPFQEFDDIYPNITANDSNKPIAVTLKGSSIEVAPKPSEVKTLRVAYYKYPTALSADSDTSILPQELDVAIIYLACAYGYDAIDEPTFSQIYFQKSDAVVSSVWNNESGGGLG